MMNIRYDPTANAAYLPVGREPHDAEAARQVDNIRDPLQGSAIILNFDETGHLIGVEVLNASHLLRPEDLDRAEHPIETGTPIHDDHA